MEIKIKRVYAPPEDSDGRRILVDRLWPRGFSKERALIDFWPKTLSPSTELRKWYNHDPARWDEFRTRYFAELDENPEQVADLLAYLSLGAATFIYTSREERLNNAVALREYVLSRTEG